MEILFWLGLCVAIGYYASTKGRSAVLWGILAFFFSPLLAGLFLALAKDKSVQADISDLRLSQQQLHDRVAVNERATAEQFRQVQEQLTGTRQEELVSSQMARRELPPGSTGRARFCGNCGAPLGAGDTFCAKCGTKVE